MLQIKLNYVCGMLLCYNLSFKDQKTVYNALWRTVTVVAPGLHSHKQESLSKTFSMYISSNNLFFFLGNDKFDHLTSLF